MLVTITRRVNRETGTPPSAGSWRFSINVQDASHHVVTIPVSITVTR
jgi:hypothetical protein